MKKTAIGPMTLLYPKPTLLIGANVNGKPDVEKVRPLVYTSGVQYAYFSLGKRLAPGFQVGKKLVRG